MDVLYKVEGDMLTKRIKKKQILVIGDIMLDIFYRGNVDRISPEAAVPVFRKKSERYSLGGAANVAANLSAAGQDVGLMAVCGTDREGDTLLHQIQEKKIGSCFIKRIDIKTTTKTRFIADNNQQLMRLDVEETDEITDKLSQELFEELEQNIVKFDLIILSDYLKGLLTYRLTQNIIVLANKYKIPVLVDVKDIRVEKYKGAYLLKPNRKELHDLTGLNVNSIEEVIYASRKLLDRCDCKYILTTCGAAGMVLVDKEEHYLEDSAAKEVYDVTGAGDTVISYLAVCLANGMNIRESVTIANKAAGIQVSKIGTAIVSLEDLEQKMELKKFFPDKRVSINSISDILKEKCKNKTIVFTNGCFDILHIGHIKYLKQASLLGDVLVVGLNSDASVKRLKGTTRPVNLEEERAELLCALEYVDYVVIYDEDTPYELIKRIQPDILVKGGDYNVEDIVGKDIVENKGGIVKVLPYILGKSTTDIIKKIKNEMEETS